MTKTQAMKAKIEVGSHQTKNHDTENETTNKVKRQPIEGSEKHL